jgi:hypothetical protein
MAIHLTAKGPCKSIRRAGARHGVAITKCKAWLDSWTGHSAEASCKSLTKVMRWYGERGSLKSGRGQTPGTLLHFSAHKCGAGELRGARRRRRR